MIEKKTFCVIQESQQTNYRLLCFLLSLNRIEKHANCIVVCKKKTKEFITSFPLKMELKLHFIIITKKDWQFIDIYRHILKTILLSINKFGHCIFIRDNLTQFRKLEIPDEIREQGYGFHKRIFNSHIEENNKLRYHSEILYVNKEEFITQIESLLEIPNFHKKTKFSKKERKLFLKNVINIEYKYLEKYNTQHFFPYETLISSEDFFSFDDILKINDIKQDLTWKEKKITFFGIRMEKVNPQVKKLNQCLLNLLLNYNIFYNNLIRLGNSNVKIQFVKPNMNNIGLWNRTNNPNGLYDVIEMFEKEYPKFTSSERQSRNYFSVNNIAILDKPGSNFLSNDLYKYNGIIGTSFDALQVKTINQDPYLKNFAFGFYFFENPKWLDEYFYGHKDILLTLPRAIESCNMHQGEKNNNTIFINKEPMTYDQIVDSLTNTKFVFLEKFDSNLMVLCFALGCVPIFESLDIRPPDLKWDKHYLFLDIPSKEKREQVYEKMRKDVLDYYEYHISPKNAFKKLVYHLFVRDIE